MLLAVLRITRNYASFSKYASSLAIKKMQLCFLSKIKSEQERDLCLAGLQVSFLRYI